MRHIQSGYRENQRYAFTMIVGVFAPAHLVGTALTADRTHVPVLPFAVWVPIAAGFAVALAVVPRPRRRRRRAGSR